MRVAIFCPTVSGKGGMESAIRGLISGFAKLGDECRLFLFGGTFDHAWLEGVPVTTYGAPQDARWMRLLQYGLGSVRCFTGWKPDAVICADGTTLSMALTGRRLTGRKHVPIASWPHFPLNEARNRHKLLQADLHLAISTELSTELRAALPAGRDRVHVIFNSLPSEHPPLVPRPASPVLLYVGRLNYDGHKRVNDLLQAVALLRGAWRLRIIGEAARTAPGETEKLHALASELGLDDRIEWLGWQHDPWAVCGPVTALVSTSSREAFGMVLVEACQRGIACVSSAVSGPLDILEEGVNGWTYPVGDVEALAARLQRILDDANAFPDQETIRNSVERFSPERVAARAREALLAAGARGGSPART